MRDVVMGIVVALGAIGIGWLAFRATVVRALPNGAPVAARIASGNPEITFDSAMLAFHRRRGILPAATLSAVRQASAGAPLDARPYLMLGHQRLLEGRNREAVALLEAGQRLDPRNRWIHILLLDRYIRSERYADAAGQFSVLARLVGAAQAPIAQAMAQLAAAPETRTAVRRTLQLDPVLEKAVLTALARANADPELVFGLASPVARATAGVPDGWGPALVNNLIAKGRFAAARSAWRRVYGLSDAQLASPIFDAGLIGLPGSPPFNWMLTANGSAGVDLRDRKLLIDYYGRDTAPLAGQLLVLKPGRYRFGFVLEGAPGSAGTSLSWSVTCVGGDGGTLLTLAVPPVTNVPRRIAGGFGVPSARCPAQQLTLTGNAGEFTAPITAMVSGLSLQQVADGS